MDFNTGNSGRRPEDPSRPLYGGEPGGQPPRGPAASPGGEFNLQDPVGSFISTARGVLLGPAAFFRGIARQGDFITPVVFALICYEIATIIGGLIGLLLVGLLGLSGLSGGQDALDLFGGAAGSIGGFLVSLILAPVIGVIFLFIAAGIFHLLTLLIVGSGNSGFEATTRVVSYSWIYQAVASVVSWIPILGPLIGLVVFVLLAIPGIREVHNTTTGKAALVVLIPVGVLVGIIVLGILAAILIPFFLSNR